ncbi:MAG: hydrolase, partial [Acidobacteriota bacterium]|nr:hydrolase [Acidobacteriota bacterium]
RLDEATTLGDRSARGIRLNYPNNKWQAHVSLREFGEAWNPAVGFAPRRGFRRLQPSVSWNPRPIGLANVRELQFQIFFENLTNLDGVLETRRLSAQPFGMRLNQGDNLGVEVANQFEYLAAPFTISEGVVLMPGEYSFNDISADFNSANQRVVSVNAEVQLGQFWSGTRRRAELGATGRPSGALNLSAVLERQDVTLPEGAFATTLMRVNAAWTPTPFVALTNSLQYDNVSRVAGLNSRLRWILRPGSDFYFVYGHNWRHDDGRYFTLSRGATTKVNYTHRF